jgi:hypothetical protein
MATYPCVTLADPKATEPVMVTWAVVRQPKVWIDRDGRRVAFWTTRGVPPAFLAYDDVAEQAAALPLYAAVTLYGREATVQQRRGARIVPTVLVDRIERGWPPTGTAPALPPGPILTTCRPTTELRSPQMTAAWTRSCPAPAPRDVGALHRGCPTGGRCPDLPARTPWAVSARSALGILTARHREADDRAHRRHGREHSRSRGTGVPGRNVVRRAEGPYRRQDREDPPDPAPVEGPLRRPRHLLLAHFRLHRAPRRG